MPLTRFIRSLAPLYDCQVRGSHRSFEVLEFCLEWRDNPVGPSLSFHVLLYPLFYICYKTSIQTNFVKVDVI